MAYQAKNPFIGLIERMNSRDRVDGWEQDLLEVISAGECTPEQSYELRDLFNNSTEAPRLRACAAIAFSHLMLASLEQQGDRARQGEILEEILRASRGVEITEEWIWTATMVWYQCEMHARLVELGHEPATHAKQEIGLQQLWRSLAKPGPSEAGRSLMNEGLAHITIAKTRGDAREEFREACRLLDASLAVLATDDPTRPTLLLNLGQALSEWAGLEEPTCAPALYARAETVLNSYLDSAAGGRQESRERVAWLCANAAYKCRTSDSDPSALRSKVAGLLARVDPRGLSGLKLRALLHVTGEHADEESTTLLSDVATQLSQLPVQERLKLREGFSQCLQDVANRLFRSGEYERGLRAVNLFRSQSAVEEIARKPMPGKRGSEGFGDRREEWHELPAQLHELYAEEMPLRWKAMHGGLDAEEQDRMDLLGAQLEAKMNQLVVAHQNPASQAGGRSAHVDVPWKVQWEAIQELGRCTFLEFVVFGADQLWLFASGPDSPTLHVRVPDDVGTSFAAPVRAFHHLRAASDLVRTRLAAGYTRATVEFTSLIKPFLVHGRARSAAIAEIEEQTELEGVVDTLFFEMEKCLHALGDHFMRPLEEWLRSENLWPGDDGVLAYSPGVPFCDVPLHATKWNDAYLIDRCATVFLPSPAMAPALLERYRACNGEPRSDFVMSCAKQGEPGMAREARSVAGIMGVDVIDTERARLSSFWRAANSAGVLHFATHSSLANPTHSTMTFVDGALSTTEVAERATLHGSRLVYLSSCESAARVLISSDDTLNLAIAFIVAGAPSVIGTYWKVEDDLCPVMAEEFYSRWIGQSLSLADAFRQAMIATRTKTGVGPHAWGNFTLVGAWRTMYR